jgi:hypothetical protein
MKDTVSRELPRIGLSKARKSISREKVRIPSLVRVKWQFPKIAAKNKKVGCILCVKACYCIYFCECNSANREDENPNSKLTSVIAHSVAINKKYFRFMYIMKQSASDVSLISIIHSPHYKEFTSRRTLESSGPKA